MTNADILRELAAATARQEAKQEAIHETVTKIEAHLSAQNGRLRKAETRITRLNLVCFGIFPPVVLLAIDAMVRHFIK
jgi:hypothetical protein